MTQTASLRLAISHLEVAMLALEDAGEDLAAAQISLPLDSLRNQLTASGIHRAWTDHGPWRAPYRQPEGGGPLGAVSFAKLCSAMLGNAR